MLQFICCLSQVFDCWCHLMYIHVPERMHHIKLQVTRCVGGAVARVSVYNNWRQGRPGNEGRISDYVCHLR